jgi:integrase
VMKLRYLTLSKSLWIYQRRFPTDLLSHPQIKSPIFKKSLGLNYGASDADKLAHWTGANSEFETYIELLRANNVDQLTQASKIEMAKALLARHKLEIGLLAVNPALTELQNAALTDYEKDKVLESGAFDELIRFDHPEGRKDVNVQLEVQSIAWRMLEQPKALTNRSVSFSDCWSIYETIKQLDMDNPNNKTSQMRFKRLVQIAGDQLLTQQSLHEAMSKFVEERESDREKSIQQSGIATPSSSSINRELNTIISIFNTVVRKKNLDIVVRRPELRRTEVQERYTFTQQEIVELVNVASDKSLAIYQPWKELMILLMAQSGSIQSELQRLKIENCHLDHQIPHIDFKGELKTKDRVRTVPIVFRLERIKELIAVINNDSGFVFGDIAPKDTKTINKALNLLCGKVNAGASAYSLRHAFKNNALASGVNVQLLAALGGWSGKELGFNDIMKGYGKTGIKQLETLKRLQQAMFQVNSFLENSGVNNVIEFKKTS